MDFKIGKCPICGQNGILIPSNNKLAAPICTSCIIKELDYTNIEDADYFCRTYNFPFNPDIWIKMAQEVKQDVFKKYALFVMNNIEKNSYEDKNTKRLDLWKDLTNEWNLIRTHNELVSKIKPVKAGFVLRNQIKWGINYSFEELIQLENLFLSTLKANNISNPMQKDAIKKACKMSVALDRAIETGDSKEINDLSKAYQNFVKTAKIDDLITASSQNVISNVAELVQFIEDQDFKFTYYDNVDRDIVDKTLKDMQDFIRRLVSDSTGLDVAFETISAGLKRDKEAKKTSESLSEVPLEDLYVAGKEKLNEDFDKELEKEEYKLGEYFNEEEETGDDNNEFF